MNWRKISAGNLDAAEQLFREALDEEAEAVIEKMIRDPAYVRQVVDYATILTQQGAIVLTQKELATGNPQWLRAREIMNKNFFGIEEASKYFGPNPTCQQLVALSEIPFSEAVLEQYKDTHLLIAIFPLSLLDMQKKFGIGRDGMLFDGLTDWESFKNEDFIEEQGEISWQLICKTPVEDSASKNWEEQMELVNQNNKVPTAREVFYTIIGNYLAAGEILFNYVFVNTSSVDSHGLHIGIGAFKRNYGYNMGRFTPEAKYTYLRLSSARRHES